MPVSTPIKQLLRPITRRVFARPPQTARSWRGTAQPGRPALKLARYGDCAWREMNHSHGSHTPVGYPKIAAERLLDQDLGIQFSDVFALELEALPARREDLRKHLELDGDPDLVLVQIGGAYALRRVLPNSPKIVILREQVGRWLGERVFLAYWFLDPFLRLFGRPFSRYAGAAPLERFLALVRDAWPDVRVALLLPHPPRRNGTFDPRTIATVAEDMRRLGRRHDVTVLDLTEPLALARRDERIFCANGWNLNRAGNEVAAAVVADWIAAQAPARSALQVVSPS